MNAANEPRAGVRAHSCLLSHLANDIRPAPTSPPCDTSSNQPGPRSNDAKAVSTSRRARASSSGRAGSIGRAARSASARSASRSSATSAPARRMSSIDSGDPQCVHAAFFARSIGAPQFEQFTNGTFRRSSSICCRDSGRMKSFSRRNSTKVMSRP